MDSQFGFSVAISGARVVVGAPFDIVSDLSAGTAYVYDLSSATPTVPVATLNNPDAEGSDQFGSSVAISETRVIVGAFADDTGAGNAGSAYVYDLPQQRPVATLNNPGPAASDQFGFSVAVSGSRVVVGAYQDDAGETNAGSAYVYDLSSGSPTVPTATLNNPAPAAHDFFGNSVAISGTRVVVGATSSAFQWLSTAYKSRSARLSTTQRNSTRARPTFMRLRLTLPQWRRINPSPRMKTWPRR